MMSATILGVVEEDVVVAVAVPATKVLVRMITITVHRTKMVLAVRT